MREKVNDYNNLISRIEALGPEDENLRNQLQEEAKRRYLEILYSNPAGFRLTARMTTNYRCLRNIYKQRHDHRLPEWRAFCDWIETLPYAREFLVN